VPGVEHAALPATTLWRVRAVLPDHPGALARLAETCGESGVNVLGLEVLPDVDVVTDELVLAVPAAWDVPAVVRLIEDSGARPALVGPAPASALTDQVVRHLHGVARLLAGTDTIAHVVADLLDARLGSSPAAPDARRAGRHHLELSVGGETIGLVREAPFTPGERARAEAVVDLAERLAESAGSEDSEPESSAPPEPPELRRHADVVVAEVDNRKVGEARLTQSGVHCGVRVYVHPAWRRRGIGGQLLREVAAMAVDRGITELDVRLDAHDLAGLRLVLASGLCGSISCDGEETRTRLVLRRAGNVA
jgi:GNAT superfamily N-acetyltransferase